MPRRVRRLEAAAHEARVQRDATQLATRTGRPLGVCLPIVRRSYRRLEEVCCGLPATALADVRPVLWAYARAEGMNPRPVLATAQELAAEERQ
jgi:hypothetical protein